MDVSLPSLQISEDNLKPSGRVMAFSSEAALKNIFFLFFLLQAPELQRLPQVTKKTFETIQFQARQFYNFSSLFNSSSFFVDFSFFFLCSKINLSGWVFFFFTFFTVHSFSNICQRGYMVEKKRKTYLLKYKLAQCYHKSLGWIGRLQRGEKCRIGRWDHTSAAVKGSEQKGNTADRCSMHLLI